MKKKILTTVIIILGIAVIILTANYSKQEKAKKNNFPKGPRGNGQNVISVRTKVAEIQTLHDYVKTNGEIQSQSEVDVFPDIGGKVFNVFVSLGSNVKKGQVLMEIDPSEPGAYYAHSPVYAPISGTITAIPKKTGTKISTSTAVTTIGDANNLQVSANIPERYVAHLKKNLKAEIILEAYPDVVFYAHVTKISPVVDKASRTKEIILNFNTNDDRINAGMFAKVKLYTRDFTDTVVIPQSAIIEKSSKDAVYVLNEDGESVSLRYVTKGNGVDNLIQITEGLKEGEKVVTEGMTSLIDGTKVHEIGSGYKK